MILRALRQRWWHGGCRGVAQRPADFGAAWHRSRLVSAAVPVRSFRPVAQSVRG